MIQLSTPILKKSLQKKFNFYNTYHKKNKNRKTFKIIGPYNFTYFPIISFINPYLKAYKINRILDCGCGVGTLSLYLATQGFEVIGIDLSSKAIDLANYTKKKNFLNNISFFNIDAESLKIKKKFDLIVCSEVIEHIMDDEKLINTLSKLMNKDGLLLITTPSSSSLLFKLGLLKSFDRRVGHLRRYKMEDLKKIIKKSGLEIVSFEKKESLIRNMLFTFPVLSFLIKFIRGKFFVSLFHQIDDSFVSYFGESNLYILSRKRS